jgi:hypothetical protein
MVQWYAFDDGTEAVLSQRGTTPVKRASAAHSIEATLEAALQSEAETVIVLLPSGKPGRVGLARLEFRLPRAATVNAAYLTPERSNPPTAGGFLGLSDEFYEPEAPKKWWQKILD